MPHSGGGGHSGGGSGFSHGGSGSSGPSHHYHYGPHGYVIIDGGYVPGSFNGQSYRFFGPGNPLSYILMPLICVTVFFAFFFGIVFWSLYSDSGYSQDKLSDYSLARYEEIYDASSETYEKNVVFTIMTSKKPEDNGIFYVTTIGDQLSSSVDQYFSVGGRFYKTFQNNVQDNYLTNLSSALTTLIQDADDFSATYTDKATMFTDHKIPDVFASPKIIVNVDYLDVKTDDITITEQLINFGFDSHISLSIVVDDMSKIKEGGEINFGIFLCIGFAVLFYIVIIVGGVKNALLFRKFYSEGQVDENGRPTHDPNGTGVPSSSEENHTYHDNMTDPSRYASTQTDFEHDHGNIDGATSEAHYDHDFNYDPKDYDTSDRYDYSDKFDYARNNDDKEDNQDK